MQIVGFQVRTLSSEKPQVMKTVQSAAASILAGVLWLPHVSTNTRALISKYLFHQLLFSKLLSYLIIIDIKKKQQNPTTHFSWVQAYTAVT